MELHLVKAEMPLNAVGPQNGLTLTTPQSEVSESTLVESDVQGTVVKNLNAKEECSESGMAYLREV